MKDIIFRGQKLLLTSRDKSKLKAKISHILSRVPTNFNSYNFSFSKYKDSLLADLNYLTIDYPGLKFDLLQDGYGFDVVVSEE